jgi:hypothetical protein
MQLNKRNQLLSITSLVRPKKLRKGCVVEERTRRKNKGMTGGELNCTLDEALSTVVATSNGGNSGAIGKH